MGIIMEFTCHVKYLNNLNIYTNVAVTQIQHGCNKIIRVLLRLLVFVLLNDLTVRYGFSFVILYIYVIFHL